MNLIFFYNEIFIYKLTLRNAFNNDKEPVQSIHKTTTFSRNDTIIIQWSVGHILLVI